MVPRDGFSGGDASSSNETENPDVLHFFGFLFFTSEIEIGRERKGEGNHSLRNSVEIGGSVVTKCKGHRKRKLSAGRKTLFLRIIKYGTEKMSNQMYHFEKSILGGLASSAPGPVRFT